MSVFPYIIVILLLSLNKIEAARILFVVPTPSISHQVVFRPLSQALATRGHDVTVITTDPAFPKGNAPPNFTEIDLHDVSYGLLMSDALEEFRSNLGSSVASQVNEMIQGMNQILETQLSDKKVQDLIKDKSKQFDLLILEAFVGSALAYSHIYKVPVIQMSSFGGIPENYATVGAPMHPLIFPTSLHQKVNNLTMYDKIQELYNYYIIKKSFEDNQEAETKIIRKHFGEDLPSVKELYKNVDMLFLNVHPVFEGIRPVPPAVIYTGGLHQNPTKELPMDLKSYLDKSKNGVIYVSFGTNVEPTFLPSAKLQALIAAFSHLPYDVLWKWNKDVLPGHPANVKISKWLPQSDLLKHPKIKLFVTQGGLQSTDEAITAGVPLVGIPMLGDQWFNVEKYVQHKIGVGLDMKTLTEEQLKNAINTVIEDKSYRRNIVRLRNLMLDQPQSALDRAVWWTEYVLRHGGAKHLLSPTANMSWWQFLEVELVLTLLSVLVVSISTIILTLRFIYKYVSRKFFFGVKVKRN